MVSVLAACTDLPTESTPSSLVTVNRIALNRIALNRIALNRIALNRIAAFRLTDGRVVVNTDSIGNLLATDDGREVFSLMVSCAMPPNVILVGTVDGTTFEFPGDMGLAIGWFSFPLDLEGQGWVSACMFARANANEVTIPISLRGANPALAVSTDERSFWTVEEGAFFGNFFASLDLPIQWYACRGSGQASGEFGGLVNRDCAEPDPANPRLTLCGLNYAGDCGFFAASHSCEQFSGNGTFYGQCHTGALKAFGGTDFVFQQVITSYVTP
jgi:hypothetical protein